MAGAGATIKTGSIFQKDIPQFRSFVCEPMQYGRLFLGRRRTHRSTDRGEGHEPGHRRRPRARPCPRHLLRQQQDTGLLESYTSTVLARVWRALHFSWWMTAMLHRFSDATDFDLRRQIAELEMVTTTPPSAAKTLADNYVGLPLI